MKLIKLLSVIIVTLVITNVTLSNRAVDQSETVTKLSQEIARLDHENTLLSVSIAEAGSLAKLRKAIDEAGFVASRDVVALGTPAAVASR